MAYFGIDFTYEFIINWLLLLIIVYDDSDGGVGKIGNSYFCYCILCGAMLGYLSIYFF